MSNNFSYIIYIMNHRFSFGNMDENESLPEVPYKIDSKTNTRVYRQPIITDLPKNIPFWKKCICFFNK
jgi:hypothetical protein